MFRCGEQASPISEGVTEIRINSQPCKGNNLITRHPWTTEAPRVATVHNDTCAPLEPVLSIHWLHSMRKYWRLSALKIPKPIPRWWCLRLSSLHVDQGLLHGLKHFCLHNQHLLKSRWRGWWWVDILVVLPIIVLSIVVVVVSQVGHMKYEHWSDKEYPEDDSRGKGIVAIPQR
jgi:hypothetical protein